MPGFTPGPIFLTVLSGQTVSSAFTLPRADAPMVVFASSNGTAAALTIQFAQSSGTAPFVPLVKLDGSGGTLTVFSGTGPAVGVILHPATPWGRISLSTATTDTISYAIYERRASA
jgi:hypothetical protein